MRHRLMRWLLVLVVTGPLCVYLVGNGAVGLFDRDEPRYAQTSRQMLQSGDWVVPRFLDKVRTAKPVLIYWCQASTMRVLGSDGAAGRFAARLPSALAMAATLALLAVAVSRGVGRRRGLWCAFVLGSSAMAVASAKLCLTDAVLLLCLTSSQLCIYRLWRRGPDAITIVALGLSAGLAGLTKGPVALGVNVTTVAALWGLGHTLRRPAPLAGWRARHWPVVLIVVGVLVATVAGPWMWAVQSRAPQFLSAAIGHDVLDRMARGQEGHAQWPGFYTLIVWGTFFPWSLLLPAAVACGWRRRHVPATRFALAAVLGPWVMFELIVTKLPHYVLPTYPALAYLVADVLVRAARGRVAGLSTRGFRVAAWAWGIGVAVLGLLAPAALIVIGQADVSVAVGALAIAALAGVTGVATALRFSARRPFAAARAMGGGTLLAIAVAYTFFLPRFAPLRLTRDLARVIDDAGGRGARGYMIDFKEPSLAFEQGGGLLEQSDNDFLNRADAAEWPAWVVVTRRVWNAMRPDVQGQWTVVGEAEGIAYSDRGRRHEVLVLRRR